MSAPTTRAILIERLGPPEVLVEREVPLEELGPECLQLEVHAAGVNFADLLQRAGLYGTVPPRPYSPGFEVAGEVVRVGSAVKDWNVGDRAIALLRHGGYARVGRPAEKSERSHHQNGAGTRRQADLHQRQPLLQP